MIKKVKNLISNIRQKVRSLYLLLDYLQFSVRYYSNSHLRKITTTPSANGLLIIGGSGLNLVWAQIWTILSTCGRINGLTPYVLTYRAQTQNNRYFRLAKIKMIYFEDLLSLPSHPLPEDLVKNMMSAKTLSDYRNLYVDEMPIGEIAISTYSRTHGTGVINVSCVDVKKYVHEWIGRLWAIFNALEGVYKTYNIKTSFQTEVFLEEYGAAYYAGMKYGIDVLQFAGTVRDDAIIIQRKIKDDYRLHHAGLSAATWTQLSQTILSKEENEELEINFLHRYSDKWHRSKRNYATDAVHDHLQARAKLNVPTDKKIAVIFSHILYDTLFFFGKDLFSDYATWLVETVREAIKNDNIYWFVKIHPSNIWRGESSFKLGGRYEEERLIHEYFGELPAHVRLVYPDDHYSPLAWMQLADIGVTVRGTAGLEMAALGKLVITAGTGRYEGLGFTMDPQNEDDYRALLQSAASAPVLMQSRQHLARLYAYAVFVLKPFPLTSLKPTVRIGVKTVSASDDLFYMPARGETKPLYEDISILSSFMARQDQIDLLTTKALSKLKFYELRDAHV